MTTLMHQILEIIAKEIDETVDELGPDVEFAELGVDRLLAETILTRARSVTGLDLPPGLLDSCPTVQQLSEYISSLTPLPSAAGGSSGKSASAGSAFQVKANPSIPLSIQLQGSPKTSSKTIHLLPDGSGSAMSYARLPPLGPDICLYGLNSPFLSQPRDFLPIPEIAPIWAAEIRKLQPKGPYILGGWSAGGYYCFEVAKHLMHNIIEDDGKPVQVEKVILIDSPCRAVFEALPMVVVSTLSKHGLMGNWGTKEAPQWLLEHFRATIARVEEYNPEPLTLISTLQSLPEVFMIWASNGACPAGGAASLGLDLSTRVSKFMLEDREDFGPNGWDRLFPRGTSMTIFKTPGTHFTLISPPHVSHDHRSAY
jgi:thioesterase domain-containing protein/acyl carrier protein